MTDRPRAHRAVAIANEKVPIAMVCRLLGIEVPEGGRHKVACPFGLTDHSDGGISPAFRVYFETNSAYCFNCAHYYTPVTLASRALDLPNRDAAAYLLDHIGYRSFDFATAWHSARQYEPAIDKALLADALKTYCRRIEPAWSSRQFEPTVAALLTRCLSLLDLVTTAESVPLWLARCKEAMERELQPNRYPQVETAGYSGDPPTTKAGGHG